MNKYRMDRGFEELGEELPITDSRHFFLVHHAILPAVQINQTVHCDRF